MNRFLLHFKTSMGTILLSAILFTMAGYIIPHIYFEFFDKTDYYKIKNPVEVDLRDYEPCQSVKVYMIRESLLTGQGRSIINLNLIKKDDRGGNERVDTQINTISFTEASGLVILNWKIACDATPGEYFFEGTMAYKIREFEKYSAFKTINFTVVASGSGELR